MQKRKLKPSQREKKRYILFRLEGKTNFKSALHLLLAILKEAFGEEFGKLNFKLIEFGSGKGILRVANAKAAEAKKTLNNVSGLETLSTSGSLKKIRGKI